MELRGCQQSQMATNGDCGNGLEPRTNCPEATSAREGGLYGLGLKMGVATFPTDGQMMAEILHSVEETMNLGKSSAGDGVAAAKMDILSPLSEGEIPWADRRCGPDTEIYVDTTQSSIVIPRMGWSSTVSVPKLVPIYADWLH